ncbi:hypothetical protein E2C01_019945 [Portunus trituberculatus]|uniref:Uncharacterized protein n=1 Tax=Portunus trituberculatus TaxID=210409 RepID=A0A5B7DZZ7_PORTR|nr:hypothetical protein [Portunus trituberculatus]
MKKIEGNTNEGNQVTEGAHWRKQLTKAMKKARHLLVWVFAAHTCAPHTSRTTPLAPAPPCPAPPPTSPTQAREGKGGCNFKQRKDEFYVGASRRENGVR